MSQSITNKLQTAFCRDKLEYALFYNWDWGLRFELNTSSSYIEMFISAFDRSRELLEYTFSETSVTYLLIRFRSCAENNSKQPKEMRRLKRCGFILPEHYLSERSSYLYDKGTEDEFLEYHHEYLFPVKINSGNSLAVLWAVCSSDLGIQPSAKLDCYFIDFDRQLVAHPYDDRGMDIVAMNRQSLTFLYKDYYHYLLEYDLKRMQTKFG